MYTYKFSNSKDQHQKLDMHSGQKNNSKNGTIALHLLIMKQLEAQTILVFSKEEWGLVLPSPDRDWETSKL